MGRRTKRRAVKIVQYQGGLFFPYDASWPGPKLETYILWDLGWDWLGKRDYLIVGYQRDGHRWVRGKGDFKQDWVVAIRGHHISYYAPNGRWRIPYKAQTWKNWVVDPVWWPMAQTDPRRFLAALKLYEAL